VAAHNAGILGTQLQILRSEAGIFMPITEVDKIVALVVFDQQKHKAQTGTEARA
jgi:hypothetical protein